MPCILEAAHDAYEAQRDRAESEARLAEGAMGDFGEALGIYP